MKSNTPNNADPEKIEEISRNLSVFLKQNILASEVEVQSDTELHAIGVDSFSLMEMILFIERSYGLVLPPESLTPENIATVRSLSTCCAGLMQSSSN